MLIKKGLDVNAKGHDGETALLQAAKIGHVAIAQLPMKEGVDVRGRGKVGRTPLSWAAPHQRVVPVLFDLFDNST